MLRTFVYIALGIIFLAQGVHAQSCTSSQAINIPNEAIRNVKYKIEGLVNSDLSSPTQGICEVKINLKHEFIGDVSVKLISPAGDEVTLIGSTGTFGKTEFTAFDVSFVPCDEEAVPDMGFSKFWSNNQTWGIFGNFVGSYYPNTGCLEDFDRGSANGTWVLQAEDAIRFGDGVIESFELVFCDPTGIDCDQCAADAGIVDGRSITSCVGEAILNLDFDQFSTVAQPDSDFYDYYYVVARGDSILDFRVDSDMRNLGMGSYKVCGLSVDKSQFVEIRDQSFDQDFVYLDSLLNDTQNDYCGSLSSSCFDLDLTSFNIVIDTVSQICIGDTFFINNKAYFEQGQYRDIFGACDTLFTLDLEVTNLLSVVEDVNEVFGCETESVDLSAVNSTIPNGADSGWTTPNGIFQSGTDGLTATVEEPGKYIFEISDRACISLDSVTILPNENKPDLVLTAEPFQCNNMSSQIFLSSNIGLSTVRWVGPNGFTSTENAPVIDQVGTYLVNVVGDNNCESAASIKIELDDSPPVMEFLPDSINCIVSEVQIEFTGGEIPASFSWSGPNGFTSQDFEPIVTIPGDYIISATGADGCSGEQTVTVVDDRIDPEVIVHSFQLNCKFSSVFLNMITGDFDIVEAVWTTPTGESLDIIRPFVNLPGEYSVRLTERNGCVSQQTYMLGLDDQSPDLVIEGEDLKCGVLKAQLNAITNTNKPTYQWFGPDDFSSELPNPEVSISGIYIVSVEGDNGCITTDSYFVDQADDRPAVTVTDAIVNCVNDDPRISVIGDDSFVYEWIGPNGFMHTGKIPPTSEPGIYTLEVSDTIANCNAFFNAEIGLDQSQPEYELEVSNFNCISDTAQINLLTDENLTLLWNGPGLSNNEINPAITREGVYTANVIAPNGCEIEESFTLVTDKDIPVIMANDLDLSDCRDEGTLQVTADRTDMTFEWFGDFDYYDTGDSVLPDVSGEYKVIGTASNGCKDSLSVNFQSGGDPPNINVIFSDTLSCEITEIEAMAQSNSTDVIFSWEAPDGSNTSGETFTVTQPGLYRVVATANDNCKSAASILMPDYRIYADPEISADTVSCDVTDLDVSVLNSNVDFNYSWLTPRGDIIDQPDFSAVEAGQYILTSTTDLNCISIDTLSLIFDNELPFLDMISNDTITCDRPIVAIGVNTSDGDHQFRWVDPYGKEYFDQYPIVDTSGVYTLYFEAENGCTTIESVFVPQDTLPPFVMATGGELSCGISKINLSVVTNADESMVSWTGPNDFMSDEFEPIVADTGVYLVNVFGDNGCLTIQDVLVTGDLEVPEIILNDGDLNCDDSPVALNFQSRDLNVDVQWFGPNSFFSSDPNPMVVDTGQYLVIAEGANGCTVSDSLLIGDNGIAPRFTVFNDTIDCNVTNPSLNAVFQDPYDSVIWSGPDGFQSTDINPTVSEPGVYSLFVFGENACADTAMFTVAMDTIAPTVFIAQSSPFKCSNTQIVLDGGGTSTGLFTYQWLSNDGVIITGEEALNPIIGSTGTYLLEVTSATNGCVKADSIVVIEEFSDLIDAEVLIKDQNCANIQDGTIQVDQVFGGTEPFGYSIDGVRFQNNPLFDFLAPGNYDVVVQDSFGCELIIPSQVSEGVDLAVELPDDITIGLGDLVRIDFDSNTSDVDSVTWFVNGQEYESILDSILVLEPIVETEIVVNLISGGCAASDEMIIKVDKTGDIYIPNVFNPISIDGNELFKMYPSKAIEIINKVILSDRFGNMVYQFESANDPLAEVSWDGNFNGNEAQPGVYFYCVDYVKKNGVSKTTCGSVTLVR